MQNVCVRCVFCSFRFLFAAALVKLFAACDSIQVEVKLQMHLIIFDRFTKWWGCVFLLASPASLSIENSTFNEASLFDKNYYYYCEHFRCVTWERMKLAGGYKKWCGLNWMSDWNFPALLSVHRIAAENCMVELLGNIHWRIIALL